MIVGIGIGVAVALTTIAVRVHYQPATFKIERSATIKASPKAVFGLINDFHQWPGWSPWAKLDPNMKTSFSGPQAGVGSVYEWTGNNKVGSGKMTINESEQNKRVGLELQFFSPMAANNVGEFKLDPTPEGTRVTWTMTGRNDFKGKAFGLFVDVDKMVGKDFEMGLATLKGLAEAAPAALSA